MNNKIDFVIAWVDGSDEDWLKQRKEVCPELKISSNQYRDWDILKYWFRGVEKYAPWVNKIHFVTWGHVPDFLNVDHPKINIVNHTDYIPKKYLPTFNSHTIELNFHRIPGLSEQFVYFNDDMFITNHVKPTDFFEDGLPKDVALLVPVVPSAYNTISGIMNNNNGVINQNFDYRKSLRANFWKWYSPKYKYLLPLNLLFLPWSDIVGLYQQHLPSSFLKKAYLEVWETENKILDDSCLSKVRDIKRDVNQWVIKEWQVMKGEFKPRNISFGKYIKIDDLASVENFKKAFNKSKHKLLCLNDHVYKELDEIIEEITKTFNLKFPSKSEFEI